MWDIFGVVSIQIQFNSKTFYLKGALDIVITHMIPVFFNSHR